MTQSDTPQPIKTQPISKEYALLREKFAEEIIKQGDRLDDLAKQLFTIILSISGIYASVLKLSVVAVLPLTLWLGMTAYQLAKQINEFKILESLAGLAKRLGGEGLSTWENLLEQSLASQEDTS